MSFSNRLESIDSRSVLLPDLHDLSEAAFADDFKQLELIDGHGLVSAWLEVDLEVERA